MILATNHPHSGFPIIIILVILASISSATTPKPEIPSGLYSIRPGEPTLVDLPYFNKSSDVEFLWNALRTLDDDAVLQVAHLGSMRSRKQRGEILEAYKTKYGTDVIAKHLHSDLFESDVGVLTRALFMPLAEFYATEIKWATSFSGWYTNENTLNDIFCCLNPKEISVSQISQEFSRLYSTTEMKEIIDSIVRGAYGKLLNALLSNKRQNETNEPDARHAAENYFDDIKTEDFLHMKKYFYQEYFSNASYEDIRLTAKYFDERASVSFVDYLRRVAAMTFWNFFSSDFWQQEPFKTNLQDLLVDIVNYSVNKEKYFLDLIKKGVAEKDNRRLIRTIALTADKELETMKSSHERIPEGAPSLAAFFLWKSGQVRYASKTVLLLLVKIICGNRDPDRDLDLEQKWDNARKCPEGDVNCGVSKLCLGAPSYLLVPADNPQKIRW